MELEADGVDRRAFRQQAHDEIVIGIDTRALAAIVGTPVVEHQPGCGIDAAGVFECQPDIVRPDQPVPKRGTGERLVDHHPVAHLAAIAAHDGLDMLLHQGDGRISAEVRTVQPGGYRCPAAEGIGAIQRHAPDQGVAAHRQAALGGEGQHRVGFREVPNTPRRAQLAHIHAVFRHHEGEVPLDQRQIGGIVEARWGHSRTERNAVARGEVAQAVRRLLRSGFDTG